MCERARVNRIDDNKITERDAMEMRLIRFRSNTVAHCSRLETRHMLRGHCDLSCSVDVDCQTLNGARDENKSIHIFYLFQIPYIRIEFVSVV